MQLKLRVGVGETITIDVEPTDTFQDLSNRLYLLAGVQVDLSQLKSNDKPFDMSTNVMQYFAPKSDKGIEEVEEDQTLKTPKLCRLCSESISHDPQFLFEPREDDITLVEKVNAALPIHVSTRDQLPKQICTTCLSCLNSNYDFMMKVVKAQKCLENVYNVKDKDGQCRNFGGCCPLCMVGRLKTLDGRKQSSVNNSASNNGMAPPPPPASNRTATSANKESVVKKDVVITVPRNSMPTGQHKRAEHVTNNARFHIKHEVIFEDTMMDKEYFFEDEVVTEYWDGNIPSNVEIMGMKKYRKKPKVEDDADWTIDEEYVPVSRRGRPKGTKNKPKVHIPVVEKSCVLCGWLGADTDLFPHAINQHCQPDMGYFPCPLCKAKQLNEMILETHINRHNMQTHSKAGTSS